MNGMHWATELTIFFLAALGALVLAGWAVKSLFWSWMISRARRNGGRFEWKFFNEVFDCSVNCSTGAGNSDSDDMREKKTASIGKTDGTLNVEMGARKIF